MLLKFFSLHEYLNFSSRDRGKRKKVLIKLFPRSYNISGKSLLIFVPKLKKADADGSCVARGRLLGRGQRCQGGTGQGSSEMDRGASDPADFQGRPGRAQGRPVEFCR